MRITISGFRNFYISGDKQEEYGTLLMSDEKINTITCYIQ